MSSKNPNGSRRPYRAPELTKVDLVVEESVLVTCKRGGSTGPNGTNNCSKGQNCINNQGS